MYLEVLDVFIIDIGYTAIASICVAAMIIAYIKYACMEKKDGKVK